MPEIPLEIVWVAAVALVTPDRRVLLQKRSAHRAHGGLWEFPGGKIEAGEAPDAAVAREIAEELGVDIALSDLFPVSFATDTPFPPSARQAHVILLYACRSWQGEPMCLDAEQIGWFAAEQLAKLAMPPLDYPLARALLHALPMII